MESFNASVIFHVSKSCLPIVLEKFHRIAKDVVKSHITEVLEEKKEHPTLSITLISAIHYVTKWKHLTSHLNYLLRTVLGSS
jgi:hypothetical protein